MLSNLASYLGYQLAPAELEPDVAESVNLSSVENDEWLLVERLEMEPSVSEAVGTSASALPGTRSSMQESWYLTPPPSFSRGSVYMETSPLENLLIEHPSMSVYQKSAKPNRRKVSNSSRSASEEEAFFRTPSEESPEKFKKVARKYSKKTSVKRPTFTSSDDGVSLPSEDEEKKEVKMKNFVKSPRRSAPAKGHSKKSSFRRIDHYSSDEMISVPSNEEDTPTIGSLAIESPLAPPRKLYSDVLRTKAKPVPVEEAPSPAVAEEPLALPAPAAPLDSAPECDDGSEEEGAMVVEDDRRRTVQIVPDQQRQAFLSRSAQKLEQRKTCELAKRSTLGRNNKAREVNSRNKRQRRSDMMQRHSGVNNNRKCY